MPFVQANSHRLYYADSHPEGTLIAGLTFIFIHGLGSSQNYYYPVIPHLTQTHRCITIDTYGAGRSPYTHEAITIPGIAEDIIGILEALYVPKAVVVGHSMGGLVAMELGARYPDQILGIVAIGPTHPSEMLVAVMNRRSQTVMAAGMEPMANTIPCGAVGSRSTPLQKAFIRELLLGQDPEGYAELCRAIASAEPPNYAAVKAPFLLIAGEEDKSASMDGCQHIFNHVASVHKSMEVLEGIGHWQCIEAADEVGVMIADFAQRLKASVK